MIRFLPIILLIAVGVGVVLWARAASALAVLTIDGGWVHVKRGALSASQRRDVQEAVHLSGMREGRIRIVARRKGALGVRVSPADEGLEQRLRNIVHTWTLR